MGLSEKGTTSERHEAARSDSSKITAGELAKAMRKAGMQVTATDLKPLATEWHHAGWTPRGGMGKCYFFRADDARPARMQALYEQVQEQREKAAQPRYGYCTRFEARYDGPYGRKRYQPILAVDEFAPGEKIGGKYTQITKEEYDLLESLDGLELEPYQSIAALIEEQREKRTAAI